MKFIYELDGQKYEYKFTKNNFIVGRTQGDLIIPDSNISKKHLQCIVKNNDVIIRDLGSSNGTYLNGRKVRENFLSDKDVIELGKFKLFFVKELAPNEEDETDRVKIGGHIPRLTLKIKNKRKVLQKIHLDANRSFSLGSKEDNDIPLPYPGVSRFHAEIHPTEEGMWEIRDLGSRNGTYVNQKPIETHYLAQGDIIQIGSITIEVFLKLVKADTSEEETRKPPQKKILLLATGVGFLLLVALMIPESGPKTQKSTNSSSATTLAQKLEKGIYQGLQLLEREKWKAALKHFKKLKKKFPKSAALDHLYEVCVLWNEFQDDIFSVFKKWNELESHLTRLEKIAKKKDYQRFYKPVEHLMERISSDRKAHELFQEAQFLFSNQKYEAAYQKFTSISSESVYYRPAWDFIERENILNLVRKKYERKAENLIAFLDKDYSKHLVKDYAKAIQIYRNLLSLYGKGDQAYISKIKRRIRQLEREKISLTFYKKARDAYERKDYPLAEQNARKVHPKSRYWQGKTGAAAIIVHAKTALLYKKALRFYEKGKPTKAIELLNQIQRILEQEQRKNPSFREAIQVFIRTVEDKKDYIAQVHQLWKEAQRAYYLSQWGKAIETYQKLIELTNEEKDLDQSYHYRALEEIPKIEAKLDQRIKVWFDKGVNFFRKGNYLGALEFFKKVKYYDKTKPYLVKIHQKYLKRIQKEIQRREKDVEIFEKARHIQLKFDLYAWKKALIIFKLLYEFLPKEHKYSRMSYEYIRPLEEKIKEYERK
ncbi:MAG: FHA domain-containing protein [Planctomycetota bacterium]|nr:MAG: FHA domain-containing protein [Planctomycetota bacterium]